MTDASTLLQQIADIGDRMIQAGHEGDVEALHTLAAQRGTLIAELEAYSSPADVDPDWKSLVTAIESQYQLLSRTMADLEQRISAELDGVQRFSSARKSYSPVQPRTGILHDHVRG